MKLLISNTIKIICVIWSHIYTLPIARKFDILRDQMHTYWCSRHYKKCEGIIQRGTFITGEKNISLSAKSKVCKGARIETHEKFLDDNFTPELVIGERCRIGHYTHITCINRIFIGNDTNIGDRCLISDNNHGNFSKDSYTYSDNSKVPDIFKLVEMKRPLYTKGPVIIENGCQIGEGSIILTGVTIGQHSIIASNSFVRENVPPYSIVAGNPSKVIRSFSDTV